MNNLFNRDDGSLQQGLANLATKYFDATSDYNKTHKDKPKMHIDFQQFSGMDWDETVKKILSGDVIGQVLQSGSSAVKTALRTGASILASGAELASGGLALGVLTDLVVDQATEMFMKHLNVFETYQKGQWVFVDRGPSRDKKKEDMELYMETSMFEDYDDVLEESQSTRQYSPGFYLEGLPKTGQHLVYVFDTEKSIKVLDNQVRPVRDKDTLVKYDGDYGMTTIRELYLLKDARIAQKYYPYQIGDEVWHDGVLYAVKLNDEDGVIIKDAETDLQLRVDEQSLTPGPRSHWKSQTEGDFRTAVGTFSRGTFAYRQITPEDKVPNPERAKGILCIVSYFDGNRVEVVDCWTATITYADPNEIIQPTISARKQMQNHKGFQELQRAVINQRPLTGLAANKHAYEWLCFSYEQTIPFPDQKIYSEDIKTQYAKKYATSKPISVNDAAVKSTGATPTKPPTEQQGMTWALLIGFIGMLLLL